MITYEQLLYNRYNYRPRMGEIQRKVSDTDIYMARKREEAARLRDEIKRREQKLKEM